MSRDCQVRARFCAPPPELARYFTSFYLAEIDVRSGGRVVDYLHPEWANLRFADRPALSADNYRGEGIKDCRFAVTGPSGHTLWFEAGTCRIWGVGLMPQGWARFVGRPAEGFADAVLDGNSHPDFADFLPLANSLFGPEPDPERELACITRYFLDRLASEAAGPWGGDDARVTAVHRALIDPQVNTVAHLAARAGVSPRTVVRLCSRAFGFAPKLLLRRQRFVRSLAQYMLDPHGYWIGALDGHYHDQAQFVREFRQFMGMAPSAYGKIEHPVLAAFVAARASTARAAMQALDPPVEAAKVELGGLAS